MCTFSTCLVQQVLSDVVVQLNKDGRFPSPVTVQTAQFEISKPMTHFIITNALCRA